MKRGVLGFLLGFIVGVISSYTFYRNKKQIMEKLNSLEEQIKKLELKKTVRKTAGDVVSSLRKLAEEVEEVTDSEKEILLNKVEEKIRKLEEIIR